MSSSDGFSLAKTLVRTCVRTMYGTRQILIIDALFTHSVLHADDLAVLFSSQAKDVRRNMQALISARLVAKSSRAEVKIGHARQAQREYYYIPLHPAIDAIKYKITRLRKKAASLYEVDEERKEWKCPHCKAEWTELEVLDKVGVEGFECHRCGHTLEFVEDAQGGEEGKHKHEKIKRLNQQLKVFDDLINKIDDVNVPENAFDDAWAGKVEVPKMRGSGLVKSEHMYVGRSNAFVKGEGPGSTDAARLQINISSGADQERQDEERKETRRKELAKQNQLPEWHTTIAGVKNEAQVKAEASATNGRGVDGGAAPSSSAALKKDEAGDSKNGVLSIEEEMQKYMEDMAREKAEAEKAAAIEDAEDQDDVDDEDFEDVITPSAANTPMGSQSMSTDRLAPPPANGVKRDSDYDESEIPSEANTPATGAATPERSTKRVRLGEAIPTNEPEDSEEDEDFEDAI